jgi:hypothetical protein
MKKTYEKNAPEWLKLYCEEFKMVRVAVLLYGEDEGYAKPKFSRKMNPIYRDNFSEADLVKLAENKEKLLKNLLEKIKQIKKAK